LKFPGSKLLHNWDLSSQNLSLNDLLRSCQQVGLTGFAEVKTPTAIAMIFYYLGGEVNALYREGSVAYNGTIALERLRAQAAGLEGEVNVYELPLDMAHLLRGITNRQKLKETLKSKAELEALLARMESAEHTGTLEVQTDRGAAMILLVNGRVSNVYWETKNGLTFEKGEARNNLELALAREEGTLFLSEFSRDVWKSRHDVQAPVRSKLEDVDPAGSGRAETLGAEEVNLRQKVLDELAVALPSVVMAFMFDLLTGSVYVRRVAKGGAALRVGLFADRVPALTRYVRDLVSLENEDEVELLEVTTGRIALIVATVPEAAEAVAVVAEKAQPTEFIAATLTRIVRSYAARLSPARGTVPTAPV
jgi:hypothetical protein